MSFKYGVLSLLALCMAILFGIKNYETWTKPVENYPQSGEGKQSEKKTLVSFPMEGKKNTESVQSYRMVSEKNIFSSERKDFPVIQPISQTKPAVRPQILLYGVTIAGEYQVASIANPGVPLKKGERELMTLKMGDQVGEYKLAKILSDRITLESESDSFDILLYDPKMPKKRASVKMETKPMTTQGAQPRIPSPSPREPVSLSPGSGPRTATEAHQPPTSRISKETAKINSSSESTSERVTPPSLPIPTKTSSPPPVMTIEKNPYSFSPGSPALPGVSAQSEFITPEGKINRGGQ